MLKHLNKHIKKQTNYFANNTSVVTVAGICNWVGCGAFFDTPPCCRCWWQMSVSVKARIVNRKQEDVAASRSFRLSWNA